MADTRPLRRDRIGAALLAALLALSVVAGAAGIGAAEADASDVVRNGDEIEITVGDDYFDGSDRNVTVRVENGKSETLSPDDTADNQSTYSVSVASLSARDTDLSNASVTVETANGTELTEYVDLRTLRFDGSADPTFSNGTLRVPLSRSLGYADGDSADVTLAGDGDAIADATVEYGNDTAVLAVSLDAGAVHLPPSKGTTLSASHGNDTDVDLWGLTRAATSVERLDGQTLSVVSPLFADGVDYDVVMVETTTNATFASDVTASDGAVTVSDETLASANELAVSAYRNGSSVFEDVLYERETASAENATVTENGTAVALSESSLTADGASVWLTNSTQYVRATAPVENGTVNLSATDYRLNPNASYRLLVAGEETIRAIVAGNESASDSGNDSLTYAAAAGNEPANGSDADSGNETTNADEDDADGILSSVLDRDPVVLVGAGVGGSVLLFGVVIVVIRFTGGNSTPDGSQDGGAGAGSSGQSGHEAKLRVRDDATDSTVSAEVTARPAANNAAHQSSRSESKQTTLSNGRGSMTLEPGKWVVEAESHGVSEQKRIDVQRDTHLSFDLGPKQVEVTVTDDARSPLSDVPVSGTPDEGRQRTGRTDRNGEVDFDVPLAAETVDVSADPEKYDADTATVRVADGGGATTLGLRPLTGGVELTATVDGTPIAGVPVELRPKEESLRNLGETGRTATTGDDGIASFDGLLVGEYEAEMDAPGGRDAYAVDVERVQVRDGRVARQTLDASFEFGLSRNQRDRVASVRQDVDGLVSATGRDVAIPRYYGSVVTALLDTIERLPHEGHRFATADADPDAVADALLDAAESSVRLVEDAMTTKRNTDLFGACVDMPDQRVEWRGEFDVATLFELLAADRKDQRQTVLTQLRAVDDRINDERSDLAGVSPARELWEGVKEFVNEKRGDDPVRGAAVAFAAGGLLDGVDELFDHEQLRERLERTVF